MTESKKHHVLKTFGLSLVLIANIFVFVPYTLYVGNLDEFITPLWSIFVLFCIPALTILGLLMVTGVFLRGAAYRCYAVLIAVIGLLVWLQGNVLVWEYGLLDGQVIDWTQKPWRGWIDLGIWIAAIGVAIVFYRTVERPVVYLAFAIFSLQLIHLTFTGIRNADALGVKSQIRYSADALQEILKFDSKKNVLHIVLDGFQSDVFAEIVNEGTDGGRYRSAMQGFVFYKENAGVFPSTYMAVPTFLSAKIYHNHMPKEDYLDATIGGKTILNSAFDAGYEIDLVSEQHMVGVYTKGRYTNAYIIPNGHSYHTSEKGYELDDAAKLLDLTLFRLAPHFIKEHVHNNQLWTVQPLISGAGHLQLWHFAHTAFLKNLADNMSADRAVPTYKLLHLMNTHWPMVVDRNCNYPGRSLPIDRKTTTAQSRCSLNAVIDVFEKMKALGIYDETLIILMADHGAGATITPDGLDEQPARESGGTVSPIPAGMVSMALPLMAIKPPGASGPMQTSTALSSLLDTAATINAILGLGEVFDGQSILELRPGERRVRGYYYHGWRRDDWETDYFGPIQEYIIDGSVFDRTAWYMGTRFPPPSEQGKLSAIPTGIKAKLKADFVTAKNEKLTFDRLRVCQLVRPKDLGGGSSEPFQIKSHAEAPTDVISRDKFVALLAQIGVNLRVSLVRRHIKGMTAQQALTALRCRVIDAPTGPIDFEVDIRMDDDGMHLEITELATGDKNKQTQRWSQVLVTLTP